MKDQRDYFDEGVLHLIYATHEGEADYGRIEADLNLVPKENRRLILLFESVPTLDDVREHLDPSFRDLPSEVLFDPSTVKRNRETLAIAYADAVKERDEAYRIWNALPAAEKQTVVGGTTPFNRHLLAWAADHCVEMVPEETSVEAWLTYTAFVVHLLRTDAAAARGDAATMWREHRKHWEALARTTHLRDTDVNAQITRLLKIERRGHDVLYVVGRLHANDEDVLVRGLDAVVYKRRGSKPVGERLFEALLPEHIRRSAGGGTRADRDADLSPCAGPRDQTANSIVGRPGSLDR